MIGANQKINNLLEKIKTDAEILLSKHEPDRDISNSIEDLLRDIINFLDKSLKETEKIYIQLREWYASHTPEAPHIMHIPLHPAADIVIPNESLRKLGSEFNSFKEYNDFFKKVRSQLDVCNSSKHLILETKNFIESINILYIYYQLAETEKSVLIKALQDLRPALENLLSNFQQEKQHIPGNLFVEGGFIGTAFSEINNAALELYRVKKIIILIKEGMVLEHINLYQKVFESQIRLNKMLSKAIQEYDLDCYQAKLYSAQAEAARLAKKYIEEVHQVTQSKLILDIEQAKNWFINGKASKEHPLHRDNPRNFLTEIRIDFLENKSIEKICSLYKDKEAKYEKALREVLNKQKLIEKFINFDRNSTLDESELVRVIMLLKKNSGLLTRNIDKETVKEALQNIGISSSFLDELESLSLSISKMESQIDFNKSIESFLNLGKGLELKKLKQYFAIFINSVDLPFIRSSEGEDLQYEAKFILEERSFLEIITKQGLEQNTIDYLSLNLKNIDNLSIDRLVEILNLYEREFGSNTEFSKLRSIIIKIYFLSSRIFSHKLYQKATKEKFFYHDEFFKLASRPKEQANAFQKYRYLIWAQKLADNFSKADESLLELLVSDKLNPKNCLLSLSYLSKLISSRYALIKTLASFSNEKSSKHLEDIEMCLLENFRYESSIFAVLARGGSIYDMEAMDEICKILKSLYLNILECTKVEELSPSEDSGAHRLSRLQYYSIWGLRNGLYHNLNKLKEKDVHLIKLQTKRLLQIGEQLQAIVKEANHDRWSGYIFENLAYQMLEQKWFHKISLINDFLRGSSTLKVSLDLFGLCDKNYQFNKANAERILSDFKKDFIEYFNAEYTESIFDFNEDNKINHLDFRELYRAICFHFDQLKPSKDTFFQLLCYNLLLDSKIEFYESLNLKTHRYSEKQRSSFKLIADFLMVITEKLNEFACKSYSYKNNLGIEKFLEGLNQKIQKLESSPDQSLIEEISLFLNP